MRRRYFVGVKTGKQRTLFAYIGIPTATSHPEHDYVIGPFRSYKGAALMASAVAANNPCIQTVADAERIAHALD